ncbi:hypothetical protein GUJ93_ZPchr0007g3691 [Zizania palustris]|uniref:Uncharacterized protein n=1 Tax=Zizania palustris TaxID=103762 RepID=A0A8J5TE70_ZIZPA|nr:hypothetical protein GUJ93_ZPchr0007g3691 [Zizania palustris]
MAPFVDRIVVEAAAMRRERPELAHSPSRAGTNIHPRIWTCRSNQVVQAQLYDLSPNCKSSLLMLWQSGESEKDDKVAEVDLCERRYLGRVLAKGGGYATWTRRPMRIDVRRHGSDLVSEDMQVLTDLQQVVANLRAYLGLALVASTLSSFPYDATGFPTASSPSPIAVAGAQGEAATKVRMGRMTPRTARRSLTLPSAPPTPRTTTGPNRRLDVASARGRRGRRNQGGEGYRVGAIGIRRERITTTPRPHDRNGVTAFAVRRAG